ncbi:MAG: TRAP transporter small permease [Desulfovermiculus sp.]
MQNIIIFIEKITQYMSGYIQAWIIFFLMFLVLIETASRYILGSPLSISNEIGGYALVCITFMGLAYTWKEKGHVRVEFIYDMFPFKLQKWVRLVTVIFAFAFALILIKASYDFLQISMLFHDRSERLRIPLAYPQSFLLIGSGLLSLQLLAEILKSIQSIIASSGDS